MNLALGTWHVLWKDISLERRTWGSSSLLLLFSLSLLCIFQFSLLDSSPDMGQRSFAGLLWLTILFSSVLGFTRAMEMERHTAGMEALLLAPIPKAAVFLGKLLGAMVFLLAVEVLWVPAFALFCNLRLSLKEIMGLAAPLVLGTLSLAMMGTLLSTLCTFSRLGNVLFSLGYFPLALPVLLISLQATSQALRPETGSQGPWVHFLMAIDLIYLISCFLLFDYLVEE